MIATAHGIEHESTPMVRSLPWKEWRERGDGESRVPFSALLATIVVGTIGSVVLASTPRMSSTRSVRVVDTAPARGFALVAVTHDGVVGGSLWTVWRNRSVLRSTPGKTRRADIVPGDEWIAYDSRRGPFGFRRADCSLRVVRIDGSDDRLVHDHVPCDVPRVLSPDGRRNELHPSPSGGQVLVHLRVPRVRVRAAGRRGVAARMRPPARGYEFDSTMLIVDRSGGVRDPSYALGHPPPVAFNDVGQPYADPRDRLRDVTDIFTEPASPDADYARRCRTQRDVLVGSDVSVEPLDIAPEWSVTRWFGNDRIVPHQGSSPYRARLIAYLELRDSAMELRPLDVTGGGW